VVDTRTAVVAGRVRIVAGDASVRPPADRLANRFTPSGRRVPMTRTAVIAGAGPGLGASVARRFAREGLDVALFARTESFLDDLAVELTDDPDLPGTALAVPTDLADPAAIADGFDRVRATLGPTDVLVNNASAAPWKGLRDCSHEELDRALDVGVRGSFCCAREAVADMLDGGDDGSAGQSGGGAPLDATGPGPDGTRGTVIFTGATTSVRGRDCAVAFSAAKFGARGIAESMARELGPAGIHVAHVVIDGGIRPSGREVDDPDASLDPDAIADSYWHLVEQDRSAWTLELDVRPHVEEF
jgi:NAD(P)-dependent dehydrogenase (short-subunit alcohol dehydrogenase family)